ncbi:hypothetical protein NQ317_011829 [Molorchus minor]|uniref:Cytochrome P450 n=1 Tax=Molorchus minor TaxID=1323400 RepID=A0ABQ9JF50_9CUCU|nr:hypothetical protein NQ317_011829 [Molorchus minor]
MKTPFVGLFQLHKPFLLVKDPDLIRSILVKDFNVFCDRQAMSDRNIDSVTSQMLFFNKNPSWNILRKKVTPVYTSGKLKSMYYLFAESGRDLTGFISKKMEETDVLDAKDGMMRYTTDLITSTAFGLKARSFEQNPTQFRKAAERLFDFNDPLRAFILMSYFLAPSLVKLFRLKWLDNQTTSFLAKTFWSTVEERKKSHILRNDVVGTIMEIKDEQDSVNNNSYDFDNDSWVAQATMFFAAGFETSSTAAAYCLYELAKNKEVQNKLREELKEALNVQQNNNIDYELLTKNLPYLEMVVKGYRFGMAYKYWKSRGFPYLEPTPPFGNLSCVFSFRKSIGILLKDVHVEMKTPFVGLFQLHKPFLLVKDPDLIRSILIKDFNVFYDRQALADRHIDSVGSQMLFFNRNPSWNILRKKVTPVYTSGKLKSMYYLFAESGRDLTGFISKKMEETDVFDVKDCMMRYTTDLITSTAFGLKARSFKENPTQFRKAAERLFDFNDPLRAFILMSYFLAPSLVKLFRLKWLDNQTASFLRNSFWSTVEERKKSYILRNDVVGTVMEIKHEQDSVNNNSYDFDDDSWVAQAAMFFVAGFETSGTAAACCLYELAKNKEIQNTLREELKEALSVQQNNNIDYELLTKNLPYLEMVVKETLRKYPVLPFLDRTCNQDYPLPGTSLMLEKGVSVFISVYGLHMDPENFPEPDQFIPERFSLENKKNIKPFSYIPFGDGPRNCIGSRCVDYVVKRKKPLNILSLNVKL